MNLLSGSVLNVEMTIVDKQSKGILIDANKLIMMSGIGVINDRYKSG